MQPLHTHPDLFKNEKNTEKQLKITISHFLEHLISNIKYLNKPQITDQWTKDHLQQFMLDITVLPIAIVQGNKKLKNKYFNQVFIDIYECEFQFYFLLFLYFVRYSTRFL
jgi:hypothetical protein